MAKKNVLTTYENYKECCNFVWQQDFDIVMTEYTNIAISLFKWTGLPSGIESEFIEKNLFEFGKCLFKKRTLQGNGPNAIIDTGNYIALQVAGERNFNLYNNPTMFSGYGLNYQEYNIPSDECVLIRNNTMKIPTIENVAYYCQKIANCEKTIHLNLDAQKMPYILKVKDKKTRLSLDNFFNQIQIGKPAIVVDEHFDTDTASVVNMQAPFVADKLQIAKENYIKALQTFLGINNLPLEKNERLIQGEVESNDIIISDYVRAQLVWRKRACKEINEKFGLNIDVHFYNDEVEQKIMEREEQTNGKIYNRTELSDNE